jgi:hypothetical protein
VSWGEFEEPHVELHELIDAGDQVFASATFRGRGKQSGAETSWDPLGCMDRAGGPPDSLAGVQGPGRGPRSRRAAGVGDSANSVFLAASHPGRPSNSRPN